jgi:hypothetical protein
MAAANSSGLTSPVGGAGAGRDGGVEGEGGDGEFADLGGPLMVADSFDLTSPVGGAGAGRDGGVEGEGGDGDFVDLAELLAADVDCCRSSNPAALKFYSPEKETAADVAKFWKEHHANSTR